MDGCKVRLQYFWENDLNELIAMGTGNPIYSKIFCGSFERTTLSFQLVMFLSGILSEKNGLAVYIKYVDGPSEKVNASYALTFLKQDRTPSSYSFLDSNAEFAKGERLGREYFVTSLFRASATDRLRNELGLVNNKAMVVLECTITIPLPFFKFRPFAPVLIPEKRIENLLHSVLDDNIKSKFADIKLMSVDARVFRCHKIILSTAAPFFFEKLFETELAEENAEVIVLPAVNGDALAEILRFIYQNTVISANIKPVVEEVLNASEMYQLDDLKKYCEICLFYDVSESNAVQMLKIAELFSLADLKCKSICVVAENFETISVTEDWSKLLAEKPSLATEVVLHATKRMDVQVLPIVQG